MTAKPGFFERLSLALKVLGDADLAARVRDGDEKIVVAAQPELAKLGAAAARDVVPRSEQVVEKVVEKVVERIVEKSNPADGALLLLAILQRDGRLVDFVNEDLAGAGDADVGAAARIVHAGCKKALAQYFTLEPLRSESEGAAVVVDKGFDAAALRLAGNVTGEPPFKGKLTHAGWRAASVRMPERTGAVDARIVAPAEVELP